VAPKSCDRGSGQGCLISKKERYDVYLLFVQTWKIWIILMKTRRAKRSHWMYYIPRFCYCVQQEVCTVVEYPFFHVCIYTYI